MIPASAWMVSRNYAGCLSGNIAEASGIIELQEPGIGNQRPEGGFEAFIAAKAQRTMGAAMISVPECDDLCPSGKAFGQFHGAFDGLAAGADEVG